MFRELQSKIGTVWCSVMHESLMWPIHGYYECRTCGRHHPAFADGPVAGWTTGRAVKVSASLLLALALATLSRPAQAANVQQGSVPADAAAVLERYAGGKSSAPWMIESVEIHAALPELEKTGCLRAIRRLSLTGGSKYNVLQLSGDRTVKQQVIARYLKAEERESALPAASIAMTRANYKFAYKGIVDDGEHLAYAFQITPRRKRYGLVSGELWLDQRTAAPVLQTGHLVKSPSAFIRRISVTREIGLHDGIVESRLTHITVETRLIGRAELVVEERPLGSAEALQFANLGEEGDE